MSKVKTVCVFLRFKMNDDEDWTYTMESEVIGISEKYHTAHDVIKAVRHLHRIGGSRRMEITNVVIG